MTLLLDFPAPKIPPRIFHAQFFFLDKPVRFRSYCPKCIATCWFVADKECVWGVMAKCQSCGEERVVESGVR